MMTSEFILEEEQIAEERAAELAKLGNEILNRPIRGLPTLKPPVCVSRGTSIRIAVQKMNDARVGCVLVEDRGRLVGVFTERDTLTKVVLKNIDIETTPVDAVMTPNPETLTPDDGIVFALNKMSVGGFRHIPLVNDAGAPVGVVAMRNIVDYIVALFPHEVLNLPPEPSLGIPRSRDGA